MEATYIARETFFQWIVDVMLTISLLAAITVLASASLGCPGVAHDHEHEHAHSRRAFPQVKLPAPTRPLTWADVNVIHTTDTHGWLLGHQKPTEPEPNYSGDLGDFASFVTHMKQLAIEKDVDLLLVDSGDVHDGTGLSDGFPAGQVDAHAVRYLCCEESQGVTANKTYSQTNS